MFGEKKLKDLFPFYPECSVHYVMKHGFQTSIDPTQAKNINCPMCGGTEGYTCLVNPKASGEEYQWGCLKSDCIKRNKAPATRGNVI